MENDKTSTLSPDADRVRELEKENERLSFEANAGRQAENEANKEIEALQARVRELEKILRSAREDLLALGSIVQKRDVDSKELYDDLEIYLIDDVLKGVDELWDHQDGSNRVRGE